MCCVGTDGQASHVVVGTCALELWFGLGASVGGDWTARMEAEAGGQVNGIGSLAYEDCPLPSPSRIGHRGHGEPGSPSNFVK
jgi:hypothetical protein